MGATDYLFRFACERCLDKVAKIILPKWWFFMVQNTSGVILRARRMPVLCWNSSSDRICILGWEVTVPPETKGNPRILRMRHVKRTPKKTQLFLWQIHQESKNQQDFWWNQLMTNCSGKHKKLIITKRLFVDDVPEQFAIRWFWYMIMI